MQGRSVQFTGQPRSSYGVGMRQPFNPQAQFVPQQLPQQQQQQPQYYAQQTHNISQTQSKQPVHTFIMPPNAFFTSMPQPGAQTYPIQMPPQQSIQVQHPVQYMQGSFMPGPPNGQFYEAYDHSNQVLMPQNIYTTGGVPFNAAQFQQLHDQSMLQQQPPPQPPPQQQQQQQQLQQAQLLIQQQQQPIPPQYMMQPGQMQQQNQYQAGIAQPVQPQYQNDLRLKLFKPAEQQQQQQQPQQQFNQPQQPPAKREKNPLLIVDPKTMTNVIITAEPAKKPAIAGVEVINSDNSAGKANPTSSNEIAALFAAQVAAKIQLGSASNQSESTAPSAPSKSPAFAVPIRPTATIHPTPTTISRPVVSSSQLPPSPVNGGSVLAVLPPQSVDNAHGDSAHLNGRVMEDAAVIGTDQAVLIEGKEKLISGLDADNLPEIDSPKEVMPKTDTQLDDKDEGYCASSSPVSKEGHNLPDVVSDIPAATMAESDLESDAIRSDLVPSFGPDIETTLNARPTSPRSKQKLPSDIPVQVIDEDTVSELCPGLTSHISTSAEFSANLQGTDDLQSRPPVSLNKTPPPTNELLVNGEAKQDNIDTNDLGPSTKAEQENELFDNEPIVQSANDSDDVTAMTMLHDIEINDLSAEDGEIIDGADVAGEKAPLDVKDLKQDKEKVLQSQNSMPPKEANVRRASADSIGLDVVKRYDRDFLMGLRNKDTEKQASWASQHVPAFIAELLGSDLYRHQGSEMPGPSDMMLPSYYRQQASNNKLPRRNSQQQSRVEQPRRVITLNVLPQDVQLQTAGENAWKPTHKVTVEKDPEQIKTENLYKKVRGILNKLTPENFKTLVGQITQLQFDSEERLRGSIDIIFEKAIAEPVFCVAYAKMCQNMLTVKVPHPDKPAETLNFRNLLLNKCQKEFEKDKAEALDLERRQKEIEKATTDEERCRLTLEKEEADWKAKRRSLGNIRFIGELFKLRMLTEIIMHQCIMQLIKSSDEESLECLCRLLTTIGKEMDIEKAKPRMDQYFTQMERIMNMKSDKSAALSNRTKFMFQEIIELRKNNWVPRRADNNPMTIDQVHRVAEAEKLQTQIMISNTILDRPQRAVKGHKMGPGAIGDDGWQQQSSRQAKFEPEKFKITKQPVDETTIKLGPAGGRGFNKMKWADGSSGGGKQNVERPIQSANRYAHLSGLETSDQHRSGRSYNQDRPGHPNRDSDKRWNTAAPFGVDERVRTPTPRLSQEKESSRLGQNDRGRSNVKSPVFDSQREHSPDSSRSRGTSSSMERERCVTPLEHERNVAPPGGRDRSATPREHERSVTPLEGERSTTPLEQERNITPLERDRSVSPVDGAEKSENFVRLESIRLLEEYLHCNDMKEAALRVAEMSSPSLMSVFVKCAIENVVDKSPQARKLVSSLLRNVVQSGHVTCEQYMTGLREVVQVGEEMEIDIPKIWQYLAEIAAPMFVDECIPFKCLNDVCDLVVKTDKLGVFVAEVVLAMVHSLGHGKVCEMWHQSGLDWTNFLAPKDSVESFVAKYKLEFTLKPVEIRPIKSSLSASQIQDKLTELLSKEDTKNEDIFDWIDASVAVTKQASFIRALVTAMCTSALTDDGIHINQERLKRRDILMLKYLDHKADLELQAVYAVQAFVDSKQHPSDLLQSLFYLLNDMDVISDDAFIQWYNSDDPKEQAGLGVAKMSANQFMSWLSEADNDKQETT